MIFGRVTERHKRICIVASGLSAAGFVPPDGCAVIAVNGAVEWLSRCDYFFTLDPSVENIVRMTNRRPGVKYYCAAPNHIGTPLAPTALLRQVMPPDGITWLHRDTGDGVLKSKYALATDPGHIHTGNSCYGALGLAYHMRPEKVLIVGLDGGGVRVNGGRTGNLRHLPHLFSTAVPQAGHLVVVANPRSTVQCFQTMEIDEGVQWLMQ